MQEVLISDEIASITASALHNCFHPQYKAVCMFVMQEFHGSWESVYFQYTKVDNQVITYPVRDTSKPVKKSSNESLTICNLMVFPSMSRVRIFCTGASINQWIKDEPNIG